MPELSARAAVLVVSLRRQRLTLLAGGRVVRVYTISGSAKGAGGRPGSNRTPTGWHRVVRWIGSGRPLGAVYEARRFTGAVLPGPAWRSARGPDRILTRILRLRGLEPGLNAGPGCDSYARYIYIHGTNREHRLGRPASHGCIRMANRDVAELFERTRGRPAFCFIHNGRHSGTEAQGLE